MHTKDYQNFILAFMNPYISQSLREWFGYPKNYDLFQTKILTIVDGTYQGYYFDIVLSVTSYQGAHLCDFSTNTLRFRLDEAGIRLTQFDDHTLDISNTMR